MHINDEQFNVQRRIQGKANAEEGQMLNARLGLWNGGRPPLGYKLDQVVIGGRKGKRLFKDPATFYQVQDYLQRRLQGEPRKLAHEASGIDCRMSSLVGIEKKALTYAGSYIWGKTNNPRKSNYVEGTSSMKDASDWIIIPDTHEAMISVDQAERLLKQLASMDRSKTAPRPRHDKHFLLSSGIYLCQCGAHMDGTGESYRCHARCEDSRRIRQDDVETYVFSTLRHQSFPEALANACVDYAYGYADRMREALQHKLMNLIGTFPQSNDSIMLPLSAADHFDIHAELTSNLGVISALRDDMMELHSEALHLLSGELHSSKEVYLRLIHSFLKPITEKGSAKQIKTALGKLIHHVTYDEDEDLHPLTMIVDIGKFLNTADSSGRYLVYFTSMGYRMRPIPISSRTTH